jgi:kynurenine formamidase
MFGQTLGEKRNAMSVKLIDLTMVLGDESSTYPGGPKMAVMNRITHEWSAGRYLPPAYSATDRIWLINEHLGTHVDAPYHFIKEGATIDALSLSLFWGTAVLVDVSHRDPARPISHAQIEAALDAEEEQLRQGDILLVRCSTGEPVDAGFGSAAAFDVEVGAWLVERNVKAVGVDLPSVDNPGDRSFPVHIALLSAGIPIFENLCNLKAIDEPRFTFIGFPFRVAGASGSILRAVAMVRS